MSIIRIICAIYLLAYTHNTIIAQDLDKKKFAVSIKTTADFYLNQYSFSGKKNYIVAYADNTWGHHTSFQLHSGLEKKLQLNASLGFGAMQTILRFNPDIRKLTDFAVQDSFKPSYVELPRQFFTIGFGLSKEWQLSDKFNISAFLGMEARYLLNSGNYSARAIYSYTGADTSFSFISLTTKVYHKKFGILADLSTRLSYKIYPNHLLFCTVGIKHNTLAPFGTDEYLIAFYNDRNLLQGSVYYTNWQRQLNFGLGYQMSF